MSVYNDITVAHTDKEMDGSNQMLCDRANPCPAHCRAESLSAYLQINTLIKDMAALRHDYTTTQGNRDWKKLNAYTE